MPVVFVRVDVKAGAVIVMEWAQAAPAPVKLDVLADEVVYGNRVFDALRIAVAGHPCPFLEARWGRQLW